MIVFKKICYFACFCMLLFCCVVFPLNAQQPTSIRAAIDIGSGGPKLQVAKVDLEKNKLETILLKKRYPVVLYSSEDLLSPNKMKKGLEAVKQAIEEAKCYGAKEITLLGASIFRNASNGHLFLDKIYHQTGLKVHVVDQFLEGVLAFHAVLSKGEIHPENLVVWDIGGGSTQMVRASSDGSFFVDKSNIGSGAFRDFIIESIQNKDVKNHKTPNPLSCEDAEKAKLYACHLAEGVDPYFKSAISESSCQIIGVGNVFGKGIHSLLNNKSEFTIAELEKVVGSLIGKKDEELGKAPYACVEVSNALLVLAFMRSLSIPQMGILDVDLTTGAILYEEFWQ